VCGTFTQTDRRDWRALASFYQKCFGCVPVPPERDYAGRPWRRARVSPGHAPGRPPAPPRPRQRRTDARDLHLLTACRRPRAGGESSGLGHLAFEVPSVRTLAETC